MRRVFFSCTLLVLSVFGFAQTKPDVIIFDEGDNATYHDASWGTFSAPSNLTLGGISRDKLALEANKYYTGNRSGILEWKSVSGGSWKIFIASLGWKSLNVEGYDSVIFFLNSRGAISATKLPLVGIETSTNLLSNLINIGDYVSSGTDADTTSWQRVSIPLSAFPGFDLAALKDVNFHQNANDNELHTMWIDNIRIISKNRVVDTTKPAAPKNLIVRSGDKSVTIHWDKVTDINLMGYNVYRATSITGPFVKVNPNILSIQGFADVNVVNDQQYFYKVTAQNVSLNESDSSASVSTTPKAFVNDDAFMDYVLATSFDYFWYEANPNNGLVKDRSTKDSPSSIAATGFGLTAIGIGIDHGYISRQAGRDRTLTTLQTFINGPQTSASIGAIGYKGWFYHFLDMNTAYRTWNCELSSVDTGWLLAGIIYAKQYFNTSDSTETAIRTLADSLFSRIDWNWMCNNGTSLTMGWDPSSLFLGSRWIGYNEAMILYILGIGAEKNPLPPTSWNAWTSGYQWTSGSWSTVPFVNFPPLFGHQYSHCWIDFRNTADAYMRARGIDYFENSRRATLAQRNYCIQNPKGAVGYGPNMWGITASDVPGGYNARGTNMNDDGTLNPSGPGGSMPFAPEFSLPALKNMYNNHRAKIWTSYGFSDAFNETVNWWDADVIGFDQGPILVMIENYRNGNVWKTFMKDSIITRGMRLAGFSTALSVHEKENVIPRKFSLEQNFPNPFNPTTLISYQLPKNSFVSIKVYDLLGKEIAHLVDETQSAGVHSISFDAARLSSGIYFYTLRSGQFTETKKMILVR